MEGRMARLKELTVCIAVQKKDCNQNPQGWCCFGEKYEKMVEILYILFFYENQPSANKAAEG